MFITVEELKTSVLNANLDEEYINPAIYEAEDVYLREILGDSLYTVLWNKKQSETLSGKYLTLVNSYIKPYLTYKVQSILVVPINFKMRNAGVVNQYDQGFSTTTVKDTAYLAEHYDGRAEFYANRLTTYLKQNASDLPEYGYSADNITNPTDSQNVTTLYLGGTRKKCNYIPTGSGGGGGQAESVEWDDILHKPQPTIGAGIITIEQGETSQSFNVNDTENKTITLSDGVTDYNELENTPDLTVYALKNDTYTKTETDQQLNTKASQTSLENHTDNTTVHITAQERTNWNGKTTMADVEAKGYAVAANLATVATTGSYNDLTDKPAINNGSLTIQKNGVDVATFTANDSSTKTANITVPTDETDLGLTTEVWAFTLSDNTTVTKTVVIK